jgi:hypothetical protein
MNEIQSIVRRRLEQINRDGGHYRLWIGNQANPDDRLQILVSQADYDLIPSRGTRGTVQVTDTLTGKLLTIRRASCGLPHCLCALELVSESQDSV